MKDSSNLALRTVLPACTSPKVPSPGGNGAYRKHSGKELSALQLKHLLALSTS